MLGNQGLATGKLQGNASHPELHAHPDDAGWPQVHGLWRSSCTHMATQSLKITHIFLEKVNQMITFMSRGWIERIRLQYIVAEIFLSISKTIIDYDSHSWCFPYIKRRMIKDFAETFLI